jgi:hypothetical protein
MEILLRWAGAQIVGVVLTAAVIFRDLTRVPGVRTQTLTEFLMAYSDKLSGIGITLCLFVLNDLAFRATDPQKNLQCVGFLIRFPAVTLLYLLFVYSLMYGIGLMTIPFAFAHLFVGYGYFFYGFLILLASTLVLSLLYVIRLEIWAHRH